jgi:carbamoyl-phosphate synthase large subunit
MMGKTLEQLGLLEDLDLNLKTYNVKAPVFPFSKFPGVDTVLGPEMKSTGEVMGRGRTFSGAFAKAMSAAGMTLPQSGNIFLSICNEDKAESLSIARMLSDSGFKLFATAGTAKFFNSHFLEVKEVPKAGEAPLSCVEMVKDGHFQLVINTAMSEKAVSDSFVMRRAALEKKIPYANVLTSARAMAQAIRESRKGPLEILPL